MLYLTCTMLSSVDFTHYGVSCAKDWVSVDYGTMKFKVIILLFETVRLSVSISPRNLCNSSKSI